MWVSCVDLRSRSVICNLVLKKMLCPLSDIKATMSHNFEISLHQAISFSIIYKSFLEVLYRTNKHYPVDVLCISKMAVTC